MHSINYKKEILSPTRAEVLSKESFQEFQDQGRLVFFGSGAEKCMDSIALENALFLTDINEPSAQNMVDLAWVKYQEKQFEDVAYFEPFYLKDFYTNKAIK